jgi:hypothetical protein
MSQPAIPVVFVLILVVVEFVTAGLDVVGPELQ